MIETPQSFVTRQECEKAAHQNGYRRAHDEVGGWARFSSTTAQGSIWLAHETGGVWLLALDHAGVIAELDIPAANKDGPGISRYQFAGLGDLYAVMPRIYELARTLPDAPLHEFIHKTKGLPSSTEAERLVIQRVGQDIFRDRLMMYWRSKCPLTGISDPALLRASHIKPWKRCDDDAERLDVHNGLLLSALWDAAFDKGLVTFDDVGTPVLSSQLSAAAANALQWDAPISLSGKHLARLKWHRTEIFKKGPAMSGQHKLVDGETP